ncbi:sigma-70 family RNA polymerase sigma factor [uncultured Pseudokineococcus sp.]|uniref:sigma-70 family RNA polymerase sigma factor n=1 Tax=uncultured Pseudokineococcus sp. TaxID=1642928 RepID=UPI00260B4011|nr:sigma-70 family RNA polymerase sigma factor [uncultured Pseudokineococcus sp.]
MGDAQATTAPPTGTSTAAAPTAPPTVQERPRHDHADLEAHRRELTAHCYRMLGSAVDAEDAVQQTMVRAWRGLDRFDGRASLRTWLYRIATNVCLDELAGAKRRAMPVDVSAAPSEPVASSLGAPLEESVWLTPAPSARVLPDGDPADVAVAREQVRLAFVAVLQHLPPRQRAVLLLREVLRWSAEEVADLLGTTTASVNSALQRARATIAAREPRPGSPLDALDPEHAELLRAYVAAFEAYDMEALAQLLHAEVVQSMPPYALWLRGPEDVVAWHVGPGGGCRGSRLVPVDANGSPALAQYKPDPERPGVRRFWALHVLRSRDGRVGEITNFLDTRTPAVFGLPEHLEG